MSKMVKNIIGKCVISILLLTTSFSYISNVSFVTSYAVENTDIVVKDNEDLKYKAQAKLLMYDIYNSSLFDNEPSVMDSLIHNLGVTFEAVSSMFNGDFGTAFSKCFDNIKNGVPFDKLEICDLSDTVTNATIEYFGNQFHYVQSEKDVAKGDCLNFKIVGASAICSQFSSFDPVYSDNFNLVNSVYDKILWTFQINEDCTLSTFYDKYSVKKGDILTLKVSLSKDAWDSGNRRYNLNFYYYINGEWMGKYKPSSNLFLQNMANPYNISLEIPFSASAIFNDCEKTDIPSEIDLDFLKNNGSGANSYKIGNDMFNLINSVDDNGCVNDVQVLDDDGNLTDDIVNYYYNYNDSHFVPNDDLPNDYNITFNKGNDDDDVVVVPDDNENNNFLTWVASILDNIINFFKYCYNGMREIFISAKGIVEYCSLIFDILPNPIGSLMKLALIIMLLVCVVNFIRG